MLYEKNYTAKYFLLLIRHRLIFRQHILSLLKRILYIFFGLGYAFDNRRTMNEDYYYDNYLYNHFVIQTPGGSGNLGLTSGLKVGWLIK